LSLEAVRQAHRLAPDIARGYVSAVAVGNISRLPVDLVAVNQRRLTAQLLREARQHGRQVHVWTVNAVPAMIDLMALGVDGIITDDPARAVRIRHEFLELSPVERLLLRFHHQLLDDGTEPLAPDLAVADAPL
jgi:glycerophosphoryl diester phosphodiesterase